MCQNYRLIALFNFLSFVHISYLVRVQAALEDFSPQFVAIKVARAHTLAMALRRYTSLKHLVQVGKTSVFTNRLYIAVNLINYN